MQIQFFPHMKHYISSTKPNRLMLFRETVAVYCENHTGHTHTFCDQNEGFLCVKEDIYITSGFWRVNIFSVQRSDLHEQWFALLSVI
jgi:hypothetical protein